ncbi:MAG: chemotaxis protein CheD [Gammaproteobacteria bacterium]|nr:chemotaxis protein CheD [Gammaproteobacteria bacterium]
MLHAKTKIFLHPGEFAFVGPGDHLHTLLGSCISITLWHPQKKIGGMCHFTLPGHPKVRSLNRKPDGRYAEGAMELFKEAIAEKKTHITEYQAKIFGGGNMMRSVGDNVDDTIGTKNAAAAMQLLMQEGVEILVAHVGEFGHRRIVFDISSGDVWVKHQPVTGGTKANLCGRT